MPRWLQLWMAATIAVFWFVLVGVGGSFALSTLVHAGEQPFTNDQAAYLREAYPRGAFTSKSTYQWCDGRIWVYFDSRGDTWNFGQQCWRVDR